MEVLSLLEGRIKSLVELVGKLKEEGVRLKLENSRLAEENERLAEKVFSLQGQIDSFEGAITENSKSLDELSQEKALTKMVVDDLIKSIDSLVEESK
jgi:cell division septum initiation protein DivIVA